MTLSDQFAKAPQVIMTMAEQYLEHPNFVALHAYPGGFAAEDKEVGFMLEGGRIAMRIFSA